VSFRAKLLFVFAATVALAVGLVAWIVSSSMRDAFERLDNQRNAALVAQFRREFARRAEEVSRRVEGVARQTGLSAWQLTLAKPRATTPRS